MNRLAALALLAALCAAAAVPARAQEPGIVAFEAVLQALVEGDDATRSAAARELAFQGRPEAVPHLLAALARPEPSPWVRKDIYGALGSLGDPAALPALLACLESEGREELVAACVAALGQIGDPAALPALLPLAAGAGAAPLRMQAIQALGGIADPAARAALIALLADPDPAARGQAARALARLGGEEALAALLARLEAAGDPAEQAVLIGALGSFGAAAATPALMAQLARLLSEAEPPPLRRAAADALARLGGPEAVAALLTLLGDGDVALERHAVQALGRLGESVAAGPLLARFAVGLGAFQAAEPEALLAEPGRWLTELETLAMVVRSLVALPPLGGGGHLERAAAGRSLPGGSADALALRDGQYRLRLAAIEALGRLPRGEGVPFLAAFAAETAGDSRLRGAAARALGEAGHQAAEAGGHGFNPAREALEALLRDPEREVRWSACLGLAALGDPAALPALEDLLTREADALVRRAAAEAAAALSG